MQPKRNRLTDIEKKLVITVRKRKGEQYTGTTCHIYNKLEVYIKQHGECSQYFTTTINGK